MHFTDSDDEQYCLCCLKKIDGCSCLDELLFSAGILCQECLSRLEPEMKSYRIEGRIYHILYRKNEFLSSVFHLYMDNNDRAMAPFFLEAAPAFVKRKLKRYLLLFLPEETVQKKGYHTMQEVFACHSLQGIFPFSGSGPEISLRGLSVLPPQRKLLTVWEPDDAGIHAACQSSGCREVFLIMAEEKWLQKNRKFIIRNRFFRQ